MKECDLRELQEAKVYVKCVSLNPNALFIFDDFSIIRRHIEPIISDLCMQGRHKNITTIISV